MLLGSCGELAVWGLPPFKQRCLSTMNPISSLCGAAGWRSHSALLRHLFSWVRHLSIHRLQLQYLAICSSPLLLLFQNEYCTTMSYNSQMMYSQPMAHQSIAESDAYTGKSAETRHLKPGELSTGTTIMAVQFDGGVVLCAGKLANGSSIERYVLCLSSLFTLNIISSLLFLA